MYIKIEIKCIDSSICRSKIVKAKLSDSVGHVISDLLEESDGTALQISRIESEGTDLEPKTPVNVLKDFG